MANYTISADALLGACTAGDNESVEQLLQNPAYITKEVEVEKCIVTEKLQTACEAPNLIFMFNKAVAAGYAEVVEYLLFFAGIHNILHDELINRENICFAIPSSNNAAVIKKFLAVKLDSVEEHLGHCGTPLVQAINGGMNKPLYASGRTHLVQLLLQNGADLNWVYPAYYTSPGCHLNNATHHAPLEVVDLLL